MESLLGVANKASEIYGDYSRGRQMRLGHYSGSDNVKKLGVYNMKPKRLGCNCDY